MNKYLLELLTAEEKQADKVEETQATFQEEADKIALTQQRIDIEKLKEEVESLKQDRKQRKYLSYALFGFMCLYMAAALVAVFLCGFFIMYLSDTVLGFLLTTTLADVIGIFSFVVKYLYHK
ncbi:MAG TPA: hypothetical protein DCW90_16120 [Lachnospiraceae bacterium]|nr:hypothetical protein [Lachnospiraceae bacterium]